VPPALKKLKPRRRGTLATLAYMLRAFFGSLFDPSYGYVSHTSVNDSANECRQKAARQANVHGVFDGRAPGPTREHIGSSDVPTSFGGGGG